MIQNYIRPQLQIKQVLEQLPNLEGRSLNACVLGPQFDLFRYTKTAERAAMTGVAFAKNVDADPTARQLVAYEGLLSTHIVDQAFTKLYAENLEGQYWTADSPANITDENVFEFVLPGLEQPNKIKVVRRGAVLTVSQTQYNQNYGYINGVTVNYGGSGYDANESFDVAVPDVDGTGAVIRVTANSSGVIVSAIVVSPGNGYTGDVTFMVRSPSQGANVGEATATLIPQLRERPIKAGDVVYATLGTNTVRRVVKYVERELVAAHTGSDTDKTNQQFAASNLNPTLATAASFGSTVAPSNWSVGLAHNTLLSADVGNAGVGYTGAPTVTVDGGGVAGAPIEISGDLAWPTEPAVVSASITTGGAVDGLTVENGGAGYYEGGVVALHITNPGSGYSSSTPPVLQIASPGTAGGVTATAEAVVTGGKILGYRITDPGAGYTDAPTVSVIGGGGSSATLVAVCNIGSVQGFTITPGLGYTSVPTVSSLGITGGTGAAGGAVLMKVVSGSTNDGVTGGTGYAVNDVLTLISGTSRIVAKFLVTEVAAITGAVKAVTVQQAGLYSGALITSASAVSGGTGADCTIDPDWGIGALYVTNAGKNYTASTSVTLSSAGGSGASVAAVLAKPVSIALTSGGGAGATATPNILADANDWSGLVEGSIFEGKYAERYTLTVIKAGSGVDEARVRVRSASGGFVAESVPATHYGFGYVVNHSSLGGLAVELRNLSSATSALQLGAQFSFTVAGKYKPLELSAGGQLLAINIVNGGQYANSPTAAALTISPPPAGGTQAVATIGLEAGVITSYNITNPGSGYLVAPTITLPGDSILGAETTEGVLTSTISVPENCRDLALVQDTVYTGTADTTYLVKVVQGASVGNTQESFTGATLEISDIAGQDTVQTLENVQQGVQYDLGTLGLKFVLPINLVGPSGLAAGEAAVLDTIVASAGVVTSIAVVSGGSGYVTAPEITISSTAGESCIATANLVDGAVQSITIVSGGSGYVTGDAATIEDPLTYQKGLRTGDVYAIQAAAAGQTGPMSVIVLNGQVVDTSSWTEDDLVLNKFDVDCRALFSGYVEPKRDDAPELAWEAGTQADGGILVRRELQLQLTDRTDGYQWVDVEESTGAKLFAHWRGLVPANSSDSVRLYNTEAAISAAFGALDAENPVCYGAVLAFRGGQGKPLFVGKLATNDVAGYTSLLRQAERIEGIYSMAVMTEDLAVHDLVKTHVGKVSTDSIKLWRRAYATVNPPGKYAVLDVKDDATSYTAIITTTGGRNVRVYSEGSTFLTDGVRAGDLFRVAYAYDEWNEPTYTEYVIQTVLEEDELVLVSGPASPINPAVKFEVWRPDTGLTQAEYAGNRGDYFSDRRVICVWCDHPLRNNADNATEVVDPYYLAAEIAGLRAAVLPQQGLTYTEILNSMDSAPNMYTKYTEEELNLAAAKGVMIVAQEFSDVSPFIRHQLTTSTAFGSLYYEDSVGTNLDNISYAVKDTFQPYIGKRNATPETLEEIETKMRDLLNEFKKSPGGFTKIGPALIEYTGLQVRIDPVFKDRVLMEVTLEFPLPLNNLIVTLRATTIQGETVVTVTPVSVNA